jgi:hypothetical protein
MDLNSAALNASHSFATILDKARSLKSGLQAQRALFDAGTTADVVLNCMQGVKSARDILNAEKSTVGLNAYARLMYDNTALDFVAETNAVIAACDTLLAWMVTNIPKDGGGYLLLQQISGGTIVWRSLTKPQLAGLVSQVDTLIAAL